MEIETEMAMMMEMAALDQPEAPRRRCSFLEVASFPLRVFL